MKKKEILSQTNNYSTLPKHNPPTNEWRVCGGFVFISGVYLKGHNFPYHHPDTVEKVLSSGKANFVKWANVKEKSATGHQERNQNEVSDQVKNKQTAPQKHI